MTEKIKLTHEEEKQVIKTVEEMVLDMPYEELQETTISYMEQHYLSKPKDYLIDCGFINNNKRKIMTKIKIDNDVSMLTDKQLKINILKFLNDYKDILVDKIQNPKVYNDEYIKKDINHIKKQFNIIKKQVKTAEIETITR